MKSIAQLVLMMTALLGVTVDASAQNTRPATPSEYLVKAGFIYNFAKFVEWPATKGSGASSPLVIGVLGNDQLLTILERVVDGKTIEGRRFVLKQLNWGRELRDCDILFITADSGYGDELIQLLKGSPILTIGETPGFAERGGVINFTLEHNKVHFEINVEAARHAGLTISSRLLNLAEIVH